MRASEFVTERKKHKRKSRYAAYGPGPYGGYGYYAGYSGDSAGGDAGGDGGGGESIKNETFDQPYKLKWEGGDYGDVDAIARMDDGNYLSIMFNKGFSQDTKEEAWSVEFYRNNSQEVTGEGDAQRVFATVLSAIQTFIKKYKPNKVYFSASKEVEQGQNAQSRSSLYDTLVQRYARAWGFRAFRADTGNKVMYELTRIKPIVAKPVAEGKEEYNRELNQKGFFFEQEIDGVTYRVSNVKGGSNNIKIQALDKKQQVIGNALFWRHQYQDGLESLSTYVDPAWQGKGIATTMYAVMRMLGVNIHPATHQSDDGKKMWDKWRKSGDATHIKSMNAKMTGVAENFADGRNPQDKGDSKRHGVPTKASVSTLRKVAKQGGRKGQLAHWMANMKSGRSKKK